MNLEPRTLALIAAGVVAGAALGWFVRELRCDCEPA